jgi:hypothetical protein
MTTASPSLPRLLTFIPLCIAIGPAIGGVVELCWLIPSGIIRNPPIAPIIGPLLAGAYVLGTPFALVSACFFVAGAKIYHRYGLPSAHVAALLGFVVVTLAALLLAYISHPFGPETLRDVPHLGVVTLVAMTGCWYVARAVRII